MNENGGQNVVQIKTSLAMLQEWERDRALKGRKKEAQLARSLDPAFKIMVMMVMMMLMIVSLDLAFKMMVVVMVVMTHSP